MHRILLVTTEHYYRMLIVKGYIYQANIMQEMKKKFCQLIDHSFIHFFLELYIGNYLSQAKQVDILWQTFI